VTAEVTILHHPHVDPGLVSAVEDLAPGSCRVRHLHDDQLPPQAVLIIAGARRILVVTVPAAGHLDVWPFAGRPGIHHLAFLPAGGDWLADQLATGVRRMAVAAGSGP
jgi:hypothetical protein